MRMKDRRIVVTGAADGFGRAICRRFADEGARVFAVDADVADLAVLSEHCDGVLTEALNVVDEAEVESVLASAHERLGGIDGLVCAARVSENLSGEGPVTECTQDAWDCVMAVNLKGVWLCAKHAIPLMIAEGGGSIVTISSMAALAPPPSFFRSHAYVTSKGAVITLTKAIAAYYGKENIRANVIAPGIVASPMAERIQNVPEAADFIRKRTALKSVGEADDVAAAAAYLISDESKYVTGVTIPVDGGWSNLG